MANDLVKAIIKIGTAVVAGGFTAKVASEGKKNADVWRTTRKQSQQNPSKK